MLVSIIGFSLTIYLFCQTRDGAARISEKFGMKLQKSEIIVFMGQRLRMRMMSQNFNSWSSKRLV